MHKEILTKEQSALLPLIASFRDKFALVGGTAISLHLGHRRSIDFDLASPKELDNLSIRRRLKGQKIDAVIRNDKEEYTVIIKGVKLTFFYYPFNIKLPDKFERYVKMPDLLTLAAMKAYALGRRSKWKDYVDLYFIIRKYHSIKQLATTAKKIFGNEFNEKNFRAQLSYFEDIDYTEKVIYQPGFETSDQNIKKALREFSLK